MGQKQSSPSSSFQRGRDFGNKDRADAPIRCASDNSGTSSRRKIFEKSPCNLQTRQSERGLSSSDRSQSQQGVFDKIRGLRKSNRVSQKNQQDCGEYIKSQVDTSSYLVDIALLKGNTSGFPLCNVSIEGLEGRSKEMNELLQQSFKKRISNKEVDSYVESKYSERPRAQPLKSPRNPTSLKCLSHPKSPQNQQNLSPFIVSDFFSKDTLSTLEKLNKQNTLPEPGQTSQFRPITQFGQSIQRLISTQPPRIIEQDEFKKLRKEAKEIKEVLNEIDKEKIWKEEQEKYFQRQNEISKKIQEERADSVLKMSMNSNQNMMNISKKNQIDMNRERTLFEIKQKEKGSISIQEESQEPASEYGLLDIQLQNKTTPQKKAICNLNSDSKKEKVKMQGADNQDFQKSDRKECQNLKFESTTKKQRRKSSLSDQLEAILKQKQAHTSSSSKKMYPFTDGTDTNNKEEDNVVEEQDEKDLLQNNNFEQCLPRETIKSFYIPTGEVIERADDLQNDSFIEQEKKERNTILSQKSYSYEEIKKGNKQSSSYQYEQYDQHLTKEEEQINSDERFTEKSDEINSVDSFDHSHKKAYNIYREHQDEQEEQEEQQNQHNIYSIISSQQTSANPSKQNQYPCSNKSNNFPDEDLSMELECYEFEQLKLRDDKENLDQNQTLSSIKQQPCYSSYQDSQSKSKFMPDDLEKDESYDSGYHCSSQNNPFSQNNNKQMISDSVKCKKENKKKSMEFDEYQNEIQPSFFNKFTQRTYNQHPYTVENRRDSIQISSQSSFLAQKQRCFEQNNNSENQSQKVIIPLSLQGKKVKIKLTNDQLANISHLSSSKNQKQQQISTFECKASKQKSIKYNYPSEIAPSKGKQNIIKDSMNKQTNFFTQKRDQTIFEDQNFSENRSEQADFEENNYSQQVREEEIEGEEEQYEDDDIIVMRLDVSSLKQNNSSKSQSSFNNSRDMNQNNMHPHYSNEQQLRQSSKNNFYDQNSNHCTRSYQSWQKQDSLQQNQKFVLQQQYENQQSANQDQDDIEDEYYYEDEDDDEDEPVKIQLTLNDIIAKDKENLLIGNEDLFDSLSSSSYHFNNIQSKSNEKSFQQKDFKGKGVNSYSQQKFHGSYRPQF